MDTATKPLTQLKVTQLEDFFRNYDPAPALETQYLPTYAECLAFWHSLHTGGAANVKSLREMPAYLIFYCQSPHAQRYLYQNVFERTLHGQCLSIALIKKTVRAVKDGEQFYRDEKIVQQHKHIQWLLEVLADDQKGEMWRYFGDAFVLPSLARIHFPADQVRKMYEDASKRALLLTMDLAQLTLELILAYCQIIRNDHMDIGVLDACREEIRFYRNRYNLLPPYCRKGELHSKCYVELTALKQLLCAQIS